MMKRCPSTSASINRPETRMKYHTTPWRVIVGVAADGAGTTTLAPAVLAAPARAPAPRLMIRIEDMGILLWETSLVAPWLVMSGAGVARPAASGCR